MLIYHEVILPTRTSYDTILPVAVDVKEASDCVPHGAAISSHNEPVYGFGRFTFLAAFLSNLHFFYPRLRQSRPRLAQRHWSPVVLSTFSDPFQLADGRAATPMATIDELAIATYADDVTL